MQQMEEFQKHVELKELDTKEQVPYDYFYIKFWDRQNYSVVRRVDVFGQEDRGRDWEGAKGASGC